MITLEQIATVLEDCGREECISNVKIRSSNGTVFSQLESRIDSKRPYQLTVTPDESLQELGILVVPLLKLREDSSLLPRLFQLNLALSCGSLCIEPSDSTLYFRIQHFCEDRNGPTPEFFQRLLIECVQDVRGIEHILLFGSMLEAGLPEEKAEQLVKNVFGDHFVTEWNELMRMRKQIGQKQLKRQKT